MLTSLSVRDVVLIEKLAMEPGSGLTVLSGETGAGKSILLDALGLALGGRGDSGLVRHGADKAVVTVAFAVSPGHAALELLEANDIASEGDIVVRRTQSASGASRAHVNDQPVSVSLLRQLGALLVEIHGQHDERALVDVGNHRRLLDAYGGLEGEAEQAAVAWRGLSDARKRLDAHREQVLRVAADRGFLEQSVTELKALAPGIGEEEQLASKRQLMMNAEAYASAISEAKEALGADQTLEARINASLRKLERRRQSAEGRLDQACAALEHVVVEMSEAQRALTEAMRAFAFDPRELDIAEERLFALKAQARKHAVLPDALPGLLQRFEAELSSIDDDGRMLKQLEVEVPAAERAYAEVATRLTRFRQTAGKQLADEVLQELKPLKLERAQFEVVITTDPTFAGPHGNDRIEFQVAANPGTPLGSLAKVASGGELSRFMLALKVVLAQRGSAPTLVFDEIDTGVGGAVADAVGQRLSRLAQGLQVLAVTHSPQVASRADQHFLISKMAAVGDEHERSVTRVKPLNADTRREEIARMLSGARVTPEARAQADRLLKRTG